MEPQVDDLYRRGVFKRGHSRKADEAIAKLLGVFVMPKQVLGVGEIRRVWQEFLWTIRGEFPDISSHNLVTLDVYLSSRKLLEERVVLCRLITELIPESDEAHCFLGHAYRNFGDLESAVTSYQYAYSITVNWMIARKAEPDHIGWADACGYLCDLADTKSEMNRYADAVVHLTKALSIVREHCPEQVRLCVRAYKVLQQVYDSMGLREVSEQCRLRVVELENLPLGFVLQQV
jgi:tetratricopeptide (TPR) repeat protein